MLFELNIYSSEMEGGGGKLTNTKSLHREICQYYLLFIFC